MHQRHILQVIGARTKKRNSNFQGSKRDPIEGIGKPSHQKRYPSFSQVKCKIPSHIVKSKPAHVVVKSKSARKYPTFDHVAHKIDDENLLERPVANRLKESYVRLKSFSNVPSSIPKAQSRRRNVRGDVKKNDQSGSSKPLSLESANKKYGPELVAFQKTIEGSDVAGDSDVQDEEDVAKAAEGEDVTNETNDPMEGSGTHSQEQGLQMDSITTIGTAETRHHFLSELQRRRIIYIFKRGTQLLKIPFPFLLIFQ